MTKDGDGKSELLKLYPVEVSSLSFRRNHANELSLLFLRDSGARLGTFLEIACTRVFCFSVDNER